MPLGVTGAETRSRLLAEGLKGPASFPSPRRAGPVGFLVEAARLWLLTDTRTVPSGGQWVLCELFRMRASVT